MKCVEKRRLETRLFDHYQVNRSTDQQCLPTNSICMIIYDTMSTPIADTSVHSIRFDTRHTYSRSHPKRGQKWHLKRYHMAPKSVPKSVPGNGIRLVSKRCRFGHRIWDPGIEHPDIENVVILRNYRKKDEIEVKTQNRAESWSKPRNWRQNDESGT